MNKEYDEDSFSFATVLELVEVCDATRMYPDLKLIHDAALAELRAINDSLKPVPEEEPSYEETAEPVEDEHAA